MLSFTDVPTYPYTRGDMNVLCLVGDILEILMSWGISEFMAKRARSSPSSKRALNVRMEDDSTERIGATRGAMSQDPLHVLLIGWMGSQRRHVEKYAQMYERVRGVCMLVCWFVRTRRNKRKDVCTEALVDVWPCTWRPKHAGLFS